MNRKSMRIFIILFPLFTFIHFSLSAQMPPVQVQKCASKAGKEAIYLKDFQVELEEAVPDSPPPVYRRSLALRKNVIYRFSLCNMEGSEDEAVLRVYDGAEMILTSWYPEQQEEYDIIDFKCSKSGIYTIMINFKEGKKGKAVGILSYVK